MSLVVRALVAGGFFVLFSSSVEVGAIPPWTTEYANFQIANDEWAPETSFGNTRANLQVGVEAKGTDTFQDIGFGYVGSALQYKPPAVIAYQQTDDSMQTKGDLLFGTRDDVSGKVAVSKRMSVKAAGNVEMYGRLDLFYGVTIHSNSEGGKMDVEEAIRRLEDRIKFLEDKIDEMR